MSDSARHVQAREQTLSWLVEAVRRGDYLEAVQWLDTLAAVDRRFTITADALISRWRERARGYRGGDTSVAALFDDEQIPDYRGLFGTLLRHAYDAIVISNVADGWMLECSSSFVALTGYSREELLGRTSVELGLIEPQVRREAVSTTRQQQAAGGFETRLTRKDGEQRWVEFSPQVLAGDELLLTILRDVTHRKELERRALELAERDPLTDIYNRRRFGDDVRRRIAEAARHGHSSALLVLDVDELKAINDTHGHSVGDAVLLAVARALEFSVRDTDVVARLGGDEFGVLLSHTDLDGAERVERGIRRRLEETAVATPDGPLAIGVSVGATAIDGEADYEQVLQRADAAMYAAKDHQRRGDGASG
jgi:diguanylate cyclase (GGDEF)-like protein/PAS domain S-box-containing protein